jgi:uncharacterized YccA/Bax inhibitor family protein
MDTSNPMLKRESAFAASWAGTQPMSLQGTINKTGVLLLLCMGSAAYTWTHPALQGPLLLAGLIGGLIAFLVGMFKPAASPVAAPLYALFEGLVLGGISQMMNKRYPGIAVNAMLLTFGVLGLMLVLYTTRTIVVTPRLAKGIIAATGAVMLVYIVDLAMRFFGYGVPFINEGGAIGIGISLVIVGIAAFNLLLDFAIIEQGVASGAPKHMEWYCGMAMLVTLVWLYLELLRLLAKLRGRD